MPAYPPVHPRARGAVHAGRMAPVVPTVVVRRRRRAADARATSTFRAIAPWLLLGAVVVAAVAAFQIATRPAANSAPVAQRHVLPQDPDPVARFTETRVGHVLFMQPDGRHCRRVLFDNVSGGFREDGDMECVPDEPAGGRAGSAGSGRLDAIRDGFRR